MSENSTFGLSVIADRYAKAFIDLAKNQDLLDKFNDDLALVKETIENSKELKDFLEHPLISPIDKKDAVSSIFNDQISHYTSNLVKLLIDKNRVLVLVLLYDHYRVMLNRMRNISTARVITAIEIDEEIKNRLKEKLERVFNQTIEIKTEINQDIIAGMIVKVGDKVLDGSIKTKFESMKKSLV